MIRDPVCGIEINGSAKIVIAVYYDLLFYFCSDFCKIKFLLNPNKYLKKEVNNEYCPVSGMKVNPNSEIVVYDGKIIGFCCPGANHQKTFLKNPEKYLKNLNGDRQKFLCDKN